MLQSKILKLLEEYKPWTGHLHLLRSTYIICVSYQNSLIFPKEVFKKIKKECSMNSKKTDH